MDNRPLKFEEFEQKLNSSFMFLQHLPYEIEHTDKMVEQIIRPTGLLDPKLMFDLRRIKLMIYSVKFKKELIGMNVCLLQP